MKLDLASAVNIDFATRLMGLVMIEPPFKTWACTLDRTTAGAFSYVSPAATLHRVKIGRYCSIGNDVNILSRHPTQMISTSPVLYQPLFKAPFHPPLTDTFDQLEDTVIGNDVWIGAGALIKTGVHIGDGAIIGAGSIVTKDVQPYTIVAGSPARVIKQRFADDVIERLQKMQWWRFDLTALPLVQDLTQNLDLIEALIAEGKLTEFSPGFYRIWRDKETQQILAQRNVA